MSYAKNLFEGVPRKNVNKSRFNLSHEWKANINMGKIIPVLCEPTLPNDEFDIKSEFMFRFAPLYYPIMHMCNMYCNFFWIPNRILWRETTHVPAPNGWKGFITMDNGGDDVEDHPVCNVDNQLLTTTPEKNDTVIGFMGFPYTRSAVGYDDIVTSINAFPLSAYLAVWDEYYRNPQIEEGKWFNLQAGDNTTAFGTAYEVEDSGRYRVFSSKWEKDYFTSALPQPQVGDAVMIPSYSLDPTTGLQVPQRLLEPDGDPTIGPVGIGANATGELQRSDGATTVNLELSSTIRDLRWAEALQTFKERVLKVGQRYIDFLKGLWGNNISPGDAQVPVWFGYYRAKINISDVVATASTGVEGNEPKVSGQYSGRADLYDQTETFKIFCSEHGWILGLMELKPNTSYGQGLPRWFRYALPTDYPLDIFAGIGDQEILKEEVVLWTKTGESAKNQETFGYIPRYSEYRYRNGIHVGNLNTPSTLGIGSEQHLGRIWDYIQLETYYDNLEINRLFINMREWRENINYDVIGGLREDMVFTVLPSQFGTTTENTIFAHVLHSVYVNRELPMFSTPKLG